MLKASSEATSHPCRRSGSTSELSRWETASIPAGWTTRTAFRLSGGAAQSLSGTRSPRPRRPRARSRTPAFKPDVDGLSRTASPGHSAASAWRKPGPRTSRKRARPAASRGRSAASCAFRASISPSTICACVFASDREAPARRRRAGPPAARGELPLRTERRVGPAEEPPGEPAVHRLPAVPVVVVVRDELDGRHRVLRPQQLVHAPDRGELDARRVPRPVAGRRDHQHRPRGRERRDLHVVRVEAQVRRVLAHVPALHVVRDHVHGGGDADPVVHRREQEGLGSASGSARARQPALVDVGERLQEVHRADAVPQVQPQRPDPPLGEARVEEAVVHLARVVVADHVPGEDDVALPGERDAPRRDRPVGAVLETAIGPVAVRREDPGKRTGLPERSVEVAGDVEPGMALEVDLLDGVVAPLDPAEDVRIERPLLRHRPQARAHQDLLTQEPGPREPGLLVRVGREGVRRVEGTDLDRAAIDPGDGLVLSARGERGQAPGCEKRQHAGSAAALHGRPPVPGAAPGFRPTASATRRTAAVITSSTVSVNGPGWP